MNTADPAASSPDRADLPGGRHGMDRLFGQDSSLLGAAAIAASHSVVITAILYYFGWARTNAALRHFGLDPRMLGYETTDYVLRSLAVTFPASVGGCIGALVLHALHRRIVVPALTPSTATGPRATPWWARHAATGTYTFTALLIGAATAGLTLPGQVGIHLGAGLPLLIVTAAAVLAYLGFLRRTFPEALAIPRAPAPAAGQGRPRTFLLAGLGLLGAFWAAGLHADATGQRNAADITAGRSDRSLIVLFSVTNLMITGTGVQTSTTPANDDRYHYHYRYTGIRLLAHTNDSLLLLPVGWQRGRDHVFIIRADDTIRLDVIADQPSRG